MAVLTDRARGAALAALAALAARQHGVVARWRLVGLGLTSGAIDYGLSVGRLHLVHRGVYAVGHRRLSLRGRWMASVLACGERAALSHRSAARLWGIADAASARIDVTHRARAEPHGRQSGATASADCTRMTRRSWTASL